jgi:hypothetical protein
MINELQSQVDSTNQRVEDTLTTVCEVLDKATQKVENASDNSEQENFNPDEQPEWV